MGISQDSDDLAVMLAAMAAGDRQAFARLYQVSSPRLFAVALKLMRQRDQAEEVLQDSYLAIWQKAGQYQAGRGQPLAWMATIVRYRAIDRMRARQRQPQDLAIPTDPENGGGSDSLALAVEMNDEAGDLRGCLETLQDKQRRAILLAYYHGFTHEELADQLDAPLGTVKSWVRRGLLQLKDCLAP